VNVNEVTVAEDVSELMVSLARNIPRKTNGKRRELETNNGA
jgi:hypothetical protein